MSEILDDLAPQLATGADRASVAGRPLVILNMASTVDGRATVDGRSGAIGDEADSALLHGLRTLVDAILVGAGTARVERYARLLRGEEDRRQRMRRGLAEQPLACIASESLRLSASEVPLLAEPKARVAILTSRSGTLSAARSRAGADAGRETGAQTAIDTTTGSAPEAGRATGAEVLYVRAERDGHLDLVRALAALHRDHGVRTLLCEGGPSLAADLIAAGLADELFLCLAPKLAGGRQELRITAGSELAPPHRMLLVSVHEHDSHLFLRYQLRSGLGSGER